MSRNLLWKVGTYRRAEVLAFIEVYPPSKTLNPGLDLAGGTSFIYELDMQGLSAPMSSEILLNEQSMFFGSASTRQIRRTLSGGRRVIIV